MAKVSMNKFFIVAAVASLAEHVACFGFQCHLTLQVGDKALDTDRITSWTTAYITTGDNSVPTPTISPFSSAFTFPSPLVVVPTGRPDQENAVSGLQLTTLSISTTHPASCQTPFLSASESVIGDGISSSMNLVQPEPTITHAPPTPTWAESPIPQLSHSDSTVTGKRGIAYNDASMANRFATFCFSCGWAYNWASSRGDLSSEIEYIPMLWGDSALHTDHWDGDCESELKKGVKALFSFNEPDNAAQANISPEQAAASHIQWMNKYAGRAPISAPSITNSGNPGEGLEWLEAFINICKASDEGCQVDFCNVHWYSEAQYADTLFEYLDKAHEICDGKPIWLTEFAPLGSENQISEFLTSVIPELDDLVYLEAYSYFMVSIGSLMASPTVLSELGQIYASI